MSDTATAAAPARGPVETGIVSRRRMQVTAFGPMLAAIATGALAIRLVYALVVARDIAITGDGHEFHLLANLLAAHGRYTSPFLHPAAPTADKPPLYPLLLALPSKLGLTSYAAHRVTSCLLGTAAVGSIGLLGRRVGGTRVGLAAAAIAAVYPLLWVIDGSLRSESLYLLLIALTLLAAYRVVERPSVSSGAMLGALIGLDALTRSEGLVLMLALAAPALLLVPRGRRLRPAVAACCACALLVVPWVARNWIVFDHPTTISTNDGSLLAGANSDATYYGGAVGSWVYPGRGNWGTNEAVIDAHLRRQGVRYARRHAARLPAVVGVRVLRAWDLWKPRKSARWEAVNADRNVHVEQAGVGAYYALAALAVYGAVQLRRRRAPLRLLLALPLFVVILAAVTYGTTRFRVPAEVSIVVLAAVGVVQVADRVRGRPAPEV